MSRDKKLFNPDKFKVEIVLLLIVKIILLYVLWSAFFSHPIQKSYRQESVTKVILS